MHPTPAETLTVALSLTQYSRPARKPGNIQMPHQLTISELTKKLVSREVSSRAALQACLDQIERVDSKVRAFISYDAEEALRQADFADQQIARGVSLTEHPLMGVPVAIKDVIAVKGQPLNCGSKILG